jgi:hypothetical protein
MSSSLEGNNGISAQTTNFVNEWTHTLYGCFACPDGIDQFCIVNLFPCCVMSNAMDSIGKNYILGFVCGACPLLHCISRDNTSKYFQINEERTCIKAFVCLPCSIHQVALETAARQRNMRWGLFGRLVSTEPSS